MGVDSSGEQNLKVERPIRTKEVIMREMETVVGDLDKLRDKGNDMFEKFPDEIKNEVSSVFDIFDDQELSVAEKDKKIEEALIKYSDKPEMIKIINLYSKVEKIETKLVGLREEGKPFKLEEIADYSKELSDKIDFDKVVDFILKINDGSGDSLFLLEKLVFLRKIRSEISNGKLAKKDYETLDRIGERLKLLDDECDEKGLFSDDEVSVNKEDSNEGKIDGTALLGEMEVIDDELYDTHCSFLAYKWKGDYKNNILRYFKMMNYGYGDSDGMEASNSSYDDRFLRAIEKRYRETVNEFRNRGYLSQDEETRARFVESKKGKWRDIFETLEIKGMDQEEGKKMVITSSGVKNLLEGSFPTAFLRRIKTIEVSNEKPVEDIDFGENDEESADADKNIKMLGLFKLKSEGENAGWGEIFIYEPISVDKDSGVTEQAIMERNFKKTLTHEIGHGVLENFSIDEIKEWEGVMEKDKTEITWYVGYSKAKSERMRKREDFCESFMMFANEPNILRILSGPRYEYMKDLFETYMDVEKISQFRENLDMALKLSNMTLEMLGMTEDTLKSYYLNLYEKK